LGSILGFARRRVVAYVIGATVMAALMTSVFAAHYARRTPVDSVWHDVSCASGIVSLALLGLGSIVGLVQRMGASPSPGLRAAPLHSLLAVGALVFTGVHLVGVALVSALGVGWLQLLVPFTRPGGPVAQGFGVLALYLMLTVMITGMMRRRLTPRWWRRVHRLGLPTLGFGCLHGVLAETPIGSGASLALSASVVVVVTVLLVLPKVYPPVAVRRSVALAESRQAQPSPAALASVPTIPAFQPLPRTGPAPVSASVPVSAPAAVSASVPALAAGPASLAPECGLTLLITQATWEADGVVSLELRDGAGGSLPRWTPGAHIRVVLPSGRVRRYSLYGDPSARDRYRVAVLRQETGQGGSREFHDLLRVGGRLRVSEPRNVFPLKPAPGYLFVAGGIGITAILPMVRAVIGTAQQWRLVYAGRSRSRMAFLAEVSSLHPYRVMVLPEDELGRPDLDTIVAAQPPGTAVYGCGPSGMLDTLRRTVGARPDLRLHIEAFTGAVIAPPTVGDTERAFTVRLRRSGQSVLVPSDRTVLDAVRALAPNLTGGCEEGFCGRCQVTVLDGVPDHRDALLSAAQRKRGCMLACVSRAKSDCLTLDV
jgi:ferredoxin-NADP reductase/DMSO/TMAO reductase YedYZ heme-binding membrane subunit